MVNIFEYGIIGMGPAGIGTALSLHREGKIGNTICFEKGQYFDNTITCPVIDANQSCCSNICRIISGVGGASTISSGKISNYPAGSGLLSFFPSEKQLKEALDESIQIIEKNVPLNRIDIDNKTIADTELFYKTRNIKYKYYDVYELDELKYREFIFDTIQILIKSGLQLYDNTEVVDINQDPITSSYCVKVKSLTDEKTVYVRHLIIATGSLDIQDDFISKIVEINSSSFEIGVRVEAPSSIWGNVLSTHGDLKLKTGDGRTYCTTQHGTIIAYQTGGLRFLEGCSDSSAKTEYTNLAVLIKCANCEDITEFFNRYQNKYNGIPIKQRYMDYINNEQSCETIYTTLSMAKYGNINVLFPTNINNNIKSFIKNVIIDTMGISENELIIVAPELKVLRNLQLNNDFELASNLFVIGAATGKFRGILQSMCSGIRCGQLLVGR